MVKKDKAPTTEASVVEKVLDAVSRERRDAHADLDAANDELGMATRRENAALLPLAKAFAEAQQDVDAHARYKAHMATQAWDAKQRILQRTLDDATAKKDAALEAAERRLAPLRRKTTNLADRCRKLAEEWASHRRSAEAAAIDLRRYWTPENPTIEEAPEGAADEAEPPVPV